VGDLKQKAAPEVENLTETQGQIPCNLHHARTGVVGQCIMLCQSTIDMLKHNWHAKAMESRGKSPPEKLNAVSLILVLEFFL